MDWEFDAELRDWFPVPKTSEDGYLRSFVVITFARCKAKSNGDDDFGNWIQAAYTSEDS